MKNKFKVTELTVYITNIIGMKSEENDIFIPGLLFEEGIKGSTKIHLRSLLSKLQSEEKSYNEQKIELFKKRGGVEEEGRIRIPEGVLNEEEAKAFNQELLDLENTEIEIEHHDFKDTDFEYTSGHYYELCYKLLKLDENNVR